MISNFLRSKISVTVLSKIRIFLDAFLHQYLEKVVSLILGWSEYIMEVKHT
jgi:hypothetical protein